MTSLTSYTKQIPANGGYYITLADARPTFYQNLGTTDAPLISSINYASPLQGGAGAGAGSTLIATAGGVFRDHGVTLVSSGRIFRKVQIMTSTNSVARGGTDGVGGNVSATGLTPSYLTGFIELPGTGGASSGSGSYTPVARLG